MINFSLRPAVAMAFVFVSVFQSCSNPEPQPSPTASKTLQKDEILLFTGSYSNSELSESGGIGSWAFNNSDGSLRALQYLELPEASYVVNSAKDSMLYTFQEYENGLKPRVMAYKLGSDYSLQFKGAKKIGGGYPCHITLFDNAEKLAISSYQDGLVSFFDLDASGNIQEKGKIAAHEGNGPVKNRQEGPHAHMAMEDARHHCLLIADLGIDQILVYDFKNTDSSVISNSYGIAMPPGSGPRHLVLHPDQEHAFVVNELSGSIATLHYADGRWQMTNNLPYMPEGDERQASGSAIRISNDGRFLYFADRTLQQIVVARIKEDDKSLEFIQYQDTMGDFPRDFNLSPNGQWLLVGHQKSTDLSVFKINKDKGKMTLEHHYKNQRPVVCFDWWKA